MTNGVLVAAGDVRTADRATVEAWLEPGLAQWAHSGLFFPGPSTDGWVGTTLALVAAVVGGLVAAIVATYSAGRGWSWTTRLTVGVTVAVVLLTVVRWKAWKALPKGVIRKATVAGASSSAVIAFLATTAATRVAWSLALIWPIAVLGLIVAIHRFGGRTETLVQTMEATAPFGSPSGPLLLCDFSARPIHHVFCATDLRTGNNLYLTNRLVWAFKDILAAPGEVTLATAVQASACLPGAFLARTIDSLPSDPPAGRSVVLSDGGVYDNMADQWEWGYANRAKVLSEIPGGTARLQAAQPAPATELVVVNASRGMDLVESIITTPGLKGELASAVGAKDVLYDVSTATRRRLLIDMFDAALEGNGDGPTGFLVHIGTSPYSVVDRYADTTGDRGSRAVVARAQLDLVTDTQWPDAASNSESRRRRWNALADSNASVKTTLAPLETLAEGSSADLLFHACVLARIAAYVVLGRGGIETDLEPWLRSRFVALVG
jgi:hypothetical protein